MLLFFSNNYVFINGCPQPNCTCVLPVDPPPPFKEGGSWVTCMLRSLAGLWWEVSLSQCEREVPSLCRSHREVLYAVNAS